jgi:hypothetical protein
VVDGNEHFPSWHFDAVLRFTAGTSGRGSPFHSLGAWAPQEGNGVTSLPILWQRLVSPDGKTCDRCNATHQELLRAIGKLNDALRPLGIEPVLEIKKVDSHTFKAKPSESNRIWMAGRPMEEWLGASVGSSPCCSVCGTSECRTIEVGGVTFEAVPERLFLKAALVAASHVLGAEGVGASQ